MTERSKFGTRVHAQGARQQRSDARENAWMALGSIARGANRARTQSEPHGGFSVHIETVPHNAASSAAGGATSEEVEVDDDESEEDEE